MDQAFRPLKSRQPAHPRWPIPKLRACIAGFAAALVLAGCLAPAPRPEPGAFRVPRPPTASTPPPVAPSSPAPAPPPPPVRATPPARENHLSPASRSLVAQARTLLSHGDLDGAASTLDRALRIEPSNPLLWVEVGKLRLAERDPHQAETCGRKALALASGDRAAQAQAGHVIAQALRAEGRNPEAAEVERQPFMH